MNRQPSNRVLQEDRCSTRMMLTEGRMEETCCRRPARTPSWGEYLFFFFRDFLPTPVMFLNMRMHQFTLPIVGHGPKYRAKPPTRRLAEVAHSMGLKTLWRGMKRGIEVFSLKP